MKKITTLFLIMFLSGIYFFGNAQEKIPTTDKENFKGFYAGGVLSTNGWGGEIKYILNKRFTIKSSFETLNFSSDYSFNESDIDYNATFDYKTGGISLLGDFNYTRNLYVSAGILLNDFNPKITGHAASDLEYGDIIIPASKVGDFNFSIKPGMKVSPYAGLGFRAFFGEMKRVVFNTEVGMFYMGSPEIEIEATGLIAPTADPAHGQKETFENQLEQYKFYPVLKLNLAIKLF
ncbi:MAG: hypothetical protein IPF54_14855 [Draconibacterium sp.]|nr:hypothetical protein [Draconibacterium sp.]